MPLKTLRTFGFFICVGVISSTVSREIEYGTSDPGLTVTTSSVSDLERGLKIFTFPLLVVVLTHVDFVPLMLPVRLLVDNEDDLDDDTGIRDFRIGDLVLLTVLRIVPDLDLDPLVLPIEADPGVLRIFPNLDDDPIVLRTFSVLEELGDVLDVPR